VREMLAVKNRSAQKMVKEKFNLKDVKEGNVKEQYQVTIR
jgi:hypothetical protein